MSYRQSPLRPRGRRRRRPTLGVVLLLVILLAAGGGVAYYFRSHATKHTPGTAAPGSASASASIPPSPANNLVQSFAAAWGKGDLSTVPFAVGLTGAEVQNQYAAIVKGLQARSVHIDATAVAHTADDNVSRSVLTVTWQLPGDQVWSYASKVDVRFADGNWGVIWQPTSIEPSLAAGDALQYTRLAPKRATILDGGGQPIIIDRNVTDIGVEAGQAGNPVTTANQLANILGVAADTIAAHIKAAKSDEFVDVITLREADYQKVSAALNTVPGIVLRDQTLALSPSHDFARSLLGTVGPVTKEIVDASKGRYIAGDTTGLGGLEQEFDSTIGGTPGFEIDVVHPASQIGTKVPTVLKVQPAVDGKSLQTTLDVRVEAAADAALQSITDQPTALVAVRISTGQVIAVANGPSGGGFDTALLGAVPPGSAFKIVTTAALLETGLSVNAPVVCSLQILVQGKTFHNYEGEQLGSVPFHTDFAKSCNTAFISLAPRVPGSTLSDTARALGVGTCWSLGTPAFRGKVAPPRDQVDLAATSFGQGSTLVSPVSLAVMAATVARGSYVAPQLVLNGQQQPCNADGSGASASASASSSGVLSSSAASSAVASAAPPTVTSAPPAAPSTPLPAAVVTQLHALMHEVVTVGTGVVLAKAPGGPVMAKTGTAEYGPGDKPKTHAWLVGYQGDIAFAVYVQDGQSGGTVAAPVALKFLQTLTPTLAPTPKK